ncbi:hypothetical protein GCM10011390_03320 [Aureimonas endophytica]|uniref:Uncharacterized protein n=1 Tax=Aureimonas endophytica TaxID=2027858 RepID=A0A917E192_9HYPH|nr:hypothetical protein [Aureimonas endophytica]GGD87894.1 hypothetical protein GCM10011390_03320 [Aureimonas endophytica]
MSYDRMDADEFRMAQQHLGLSDASMALMLGISDPQHVRRLKAGPEAGYAREIKPWHVRLIRAYLEGYRPADWPQENFSPRMRRT